MSQVPPPPIVNAEVDATQIQRSREERRTTGRIVAVIVALSIIALACYHAWIRKTAVLAGVIVPALIMVLYTAWVLYTAKRDKYRRNLELNGASLAEVLSMGPVSKSKTDEEGVAGDRKGSIPAPASKIGLDDKQKHKGTHRTSLENDQINRDFQAHVAKQTGFQEKANKDSSRSQNVGKNKSRPRMTLPHIPPHSGGGTPASTADINEKSNAKMYHRSQSAA